MFLCDLELHGAFEYVGQYQNFERLCFWENMLTWKLNIQKQYHLKASRIYYLVARCSEFTPNKFGIYSVMIIQECLCNLCR